LKAKYVIYIIIFILFLIYMVSSNYIFTTLLTVENESSRGFLKLPESTQDIRINIDDINETKIKWKDMVLIEGWAFKRKQNKEENCRYLVLRSTDAYYTFKLNDSKRRVDVAQYFDLNNAFIGFNALIAKDIIKQGVYRLGIIIENEGDNYFSLSNKFLTKENNRIISGFISTKMKITIEKSEKTVKYSVDLIEEQDGFIKIQGWSFLEGLYSNDIKHYILLRKDDEVVVFDTVNIIRKDVTEAFKNYGLNLDNSGFEARLPKDTMEKGNYQLGLYVVNGKEKGSIFTEQYINIY